MLLLGWDGLLQLCLCLCQLLFGLCQRLLHVPHQRFCVVNRMHSNIAFWRLNGPDQFWMGVGAGWRGGLHR